MTTLESSATCNCQAATARIIAASEAPFKQTQSSPADQRDVNAIPLSSILSLSQDLVLHWETLNGCLNADTHLNPFVLRATAEMVGRALTLLEAAVAALSPQTARGRPRMHATGRLRARQPAGPRSTQHGLGLETESASRVTCNLDVTTTFIGGFQLDDEEEIAIVHREALRHAVIRLGAVVQDIEEEIREKSVMEVEGGEQPLKDSEVKALIGRLFRLLGKVNDSGR